MPDPIVLGRNLHVVGANPSPERWWGRSWEEGPSAGVVEEGGGQLLAEGDGIVAGDALAQDDAAVVGGDEAAHGDGAVGRGLGVGADGEVAATAELGQEGALGVD